VGVYLKDNQPEGAEAVLPEANQTGDEPLANEKIRRRAVAKATAELTLQEGRRLVQEGAWQRGLEVLYGALNMFRQLKDLDGKARTFLEIGHVHMLFDDYEVAQVAFYDAERLFRKSGREKGIAYTHLRLGTLALHMRQPDEARKHLRSASTFFHQHDDPKHARISDQLLRLADEYDPVPWLEPLPSPEPSSEAEKNPEKEAAPE
jgi:tetratricopeptide (TPR) repeat protein